MWWRLLYTISWFGYPLYVKLRFAELPVPSSRPQRIGTDIVDAELKNLAVTVPTVPEDFVAINESAAAVIVTVGDDA